jgi:hypothetical protein
MRTPPFITCPLCGWTSFLEGDIVHRFCAHCHRFHDEMTTEEVQAATAARRREEEARARALLPLFLSLFGLSRPGKDRP